MASRAATGIPVHVAGLLPPRILPSAGPDPRAACGEPQARAVLTGAAVSFRAAREAGARVHARDRVEMGVRAREARSLIGSRACTTSGGPMKIVEKEFPFPTLMLVMAAIPLVSGCAMSVKHRQPTFRDLMD